MLPCFSSDPPSRATTLHLVSRGDFDGWRQRHPQHDGWLAHCAWRADPGSFTFLPAANDAPPSALASAADGESIWALGGLPLTLPEGLYALASDSQLPSAAWLGWALGAYQFDRYKAPRRAPAALIVPQDETSETQALAAAVYLARDLINTPAEDMGPVQLCAAAREVAQRFGAEVEAIEGGELLQRGYPTIHLVCRASPRMPALIDLRWGDPAAPLVTLVGKGVCFDTGGLHIKGHEGMQEMKKDMAGAAIVLGLAQALMATAAPLRLRVLIPAVDNAIAGDAMRPRDVVRTRSGKTVEIGFTDAEGRLVLCDALSEACAEPPALVIDVATLTGSAKATLGSEVQALFCDDDALAASLVHESFEVGDPVWRLPLWRAYRKRLDSPIADFGNVAKGLFADAIVAALYLQEFVPRSQPWMHLDVMGTNPLPRPGRPEGGEATGLLALYRLLRRRWVAPGAPS